MYRLIRKSPFGVAVALLTIAVLAIVPFLPGRFTQRAFRAAKRQWLINTGGMIDVGGYYLRIECSGNGRTVVFDSGLNQPRGTWGIVPDEVAKFARVCTYDRAGVGESDSAGFTRTSADVVRELKALLEKAGEKGPFLLVGHSFGGMNARLFARTYREEVNGLLLVEPSHEDQYLRFAQLMREPDRDKYLRHEGGGNDERVDLLASADELSTFQEVSIQRTILLTAVDDSQSAESSIRHELNARLARSHPSIVHLPIENCGHFPQLDRPEVVVAAASKLLQ